MEIIKKAYVANADEEAYVDHQDEPNADIPRPKFPELYAARRGALAGSLLATKGIRREDKEGRKWWHTEGLKNFGAPAVIYIFVERELFFQGDSRNVWSVFDSGLMAQTIMLLAMKYGLGTVAQRQAVVFPDVVRSTLGIQDSWILVLGIAVGYPDWNDPINQLRSTREPLEKVAKWYGFD